MKPKVIIVDEQDNIIGYKDRESVKQEDIYRVSALWITNSRGDILLAQRAFTKSHNPGKWGPAVAGTVEEGEDYEKNIYKEAEEEIGLKNIKFKLGPKERRTGEHNYFLQWYLLVINKPENEFIRQESEVEAINWFTREKLKNDMKIEPSKFLSSLDHYIKNLSI
jgi:isopentenyl-diphosphate delta-isomerase